MVVIFGITILVTMVLTAYGTLKAVQYGLRWQMETKQDMKPTMPNIISEQIEKKEQQQQEAITNTILNEYLNGGDPR